MATACKRWPNHAEWARCDCISLARKGRAALVDGLEVVSDPVTLRRMARAIESFREIEERLKAVGPGVEHGE